MASAGWALQKALFTHLSADSNVTGVLGGAKIYDDVPRDATFPYVTFGESVVRDWSTGSDEGFEHVVTLHAWSRANGRRESHEIVGALRSSLHDQALAVEGHRLINLRHEFSEARREADGETYHGIVRYRAVTEPTN